MPVRKENVSADVSHGHRDRRAIGQRKFPQPVSNAEFMRALRKALKRPIGLPAASWMVRIGAPLLMKTDPELALYGRYCVSRRLRDEEFEFSFPDLESALRDIYA